MPKSDRCKEINILILQTIYYTYYASHKKRWATNDKAKKTKGGGSQNFTTPRNFEPRKIKRQISYEWCQIVRA